VRSMRKCNTYYVIGYFYDPVTDKLRLFNGGNINNALLYTCKRIAQEIDRLALRLNIITFWTYLSLPRGVDILSDADVFEDLIRQRRVALIHIIGFSHTLVTLEIL
jgi:hypothetical protein